MAPLLLVCLLNLFLAPALTAQERPAETWIGRAHALGLAGTPGWRALLHFRPGDRHSSLTDPKFYLDPAGPGDPSCELDADLRALADTPSFMDRFPARAEWLIQQLRLDRATLPQPFCEGFERAWKAHTPKAAVMVFADAYMSSPASMFGHTLLVFRARTGSDQLQQAVNYAAVTQETSGLVFAWKGIFGLYPGSFSLMPYYKKLQEYTHTEHRDLWECELALDESQLRLLALHLWEVQGLGSPYYFFDRNCSYQLLHLLAAVCPEAPLFQSLPPWVLPLDTLRAVQTAGLVRSMHWRPSLVNQVRLQTAELTGEERAEAKAVGEGANPAALAGAPDRQAKVLDLASAWLQARRSQNKVDQSTYQERQLAILGSRSRLGQGAASESPQAPASPLEGHLAQRAEVAWCEEGGRKGLELSWRPAFHDWMDPQAGFAPGSGISFMDISARAWEGDPQPELSRVTFVQVQSFQPVDRFFHPPSWTGGVRWEVEPAGPDGRPRRQMVGNLGAGISLGGQRFLFYTLAAGEARTFRQNSGYSLGPGLESGMILDAGDWLRVRPYVRWIKRVAGQTGEDLRQGVEARLHLGRKGSFQFALERARLQGFDMTTAKLGVMAYF